MGGLIPIAENPRANALQRFLSEDLVPLNFLNTISPSVFLRLVAESFTKSVLGDPSPSYQRCVICAMRASSREQEAALGGKGVRGEKFLFHENYGQERTLSKEFEIILVTAKQGYC